MEQTLAIIKPDGVARGQIGEVVSRCERAGLAVRGLKMVWLAPAQAQQRAVLAINGNHQILLKSGARLAFDDDRRSNNRARTGHRNQDRFQTRAFRRGDRRRGRLRGCLGGNYNHVGCLRGRFGGHRQRSIAGWQHNGRSGCGTSLKQERRKQK